METTTRLGLVATLLLSGCSLVIDSGQYTGGGDGGVADTGTGDSGADTGPGDSGADTGPSPDGGTCGGCGAGQVMNDFGHCVVAIECDPSCGSGFVCDRWLGVCQSPFDCSSCSAADGSSCADGIRCAATCECPPETDFQPEINPEGRCVPCNTIFDPGSTDPFVWDPVEQSCVPPSPSCDPPTDCNGLCVNLMTDSTNCGWCGNFCAGTCSAGLCLTSCVAPLTDCDGTGSCVDLMTDSTNCGSCGIPCSSTETCIAGACSGTSCPGIQTNCGGSCVDLMTDSTNCNTCGVACATDETCVDGLCTPAPPPFCECASGEICLGGSGFCVAPGTCDSVYPIPGCSGAARVSDMPAFQLGSWPYTPTLRRFDLHITGNVSGTPTSPRPGWTMFWRTQTGAIEAAFASPESDSASGGGCYFGGTLGGAGRCTGVAGGFSHMDARTVYAGTASTTGGPARPVDAVVTANNPATGSVIELWKLTTTTSADGRPTNVCLTISDTWNRLDASGTALPTVNGLSLAAMGPGVSTFATLGLRTMASFGQGFMLPATDNVGRNFGPVAGGYATGLYLGSANRAVTGWDTGIDADTYIFPGTAGTPVAAIDPSSSFEPEIFAFERNDSALETVTCGLMGTTPTFQCSSVGVLGISAVPGAPIAAYRSTGVTTLLALETSASGNQLVRHSGSDTWPVLTDATVGGMITGLIAVDAEGVLLIDPTSRTQQGWDYVWAAFIVVDRAGVESLELWTGAERQCS